jgi:LysR family transcriptional regulator, hydrogen peroxide-inducible genes activator
MEVHQLRYFCAIAKHGTFTSAARSEHVAQPSLSQQIGKLEDELGGKLFYRMPRAARLTVLGEFFLPRALGILQQIRESKAGARHILELRDLEPRQGIVPITASELPASTELNLNGVHSLRKSA